MKFLIIIPAHNEEKFLHYCLKSLQMQTYQEFEVMVVNDGSTDKTKEIAEKFCAANHRFQILNLKSSKHEPGAKVVRTFNKGLEHIGLDHFDIICKFDADIIFPQNYLEVIVQVYQENRNAGMVSGLVRVHKQSFKENFSHDFSNAEDWVFENISSKNHIRGPIKSYRKECFLAMKGLRAVLGWDNIDVMLAKMHGYETVTLKNLWVKHLRPTAYKYKDQKAKKLGEYFYNIGLSFPLAIISSAKSSFKNKSFREFFTTMNSYAKQKSERVLTYKEIRFIRKLRWSELFQKIKIIHEKN